MSRTGTIPATTKETIFFETEAAKKQFIAEGREIIHVRSVLVLSKDRVFRQGVPGY